MSEKTCMPVWGPYSKKYMGLSRIMGDISNKNGKSNANAVRFDFAVHPTIWNSPMLRFRQAIICGNVQQITHSIHTDMSLCGRIWFMPMCPFQK